VDPVPDPLLLKKSGSAGNRTRTSGSVRARHANGGGGAELLGRLQNGTHRVKNVSVEGSAGRGGYGLGFGNTVYLQKSYFNNRKFLKIIIVSLNRLSDWSLYLANTYFYEERTGILFII
jgi:hypothetical protein